MRTEIAINKVGKGYSIEIISYARSNSKIFSEIPGQIFCDRVGRIPTNEPNGYEMVFGYIDGREGNIGYLTGKVVRDVRDEEA